MLLIFLDEATNTQLKPIQTFSIMQIAFDDGGFALDDEGKPSLNVAFDTDDAWDDTEILQIFDAAVRSHVTKGQPSKNKKEKSSSLKEV